MNAEQELLVAQDEALERQRQYSEIESDLIRFMDERLGVKGVIGEDDLGVSLNESMKGYNLAGLKLIRHLSSKYGGDRHEMINVDPVGLSIEEAARAVYFFSEEPEVVLTSKDLFDSARSLRLGQALVFDIKASGKSVEDFEKGYFEPAFSQAFSERSHLFSLDKNDGTYTVRRVK